MNRVMYVFAVSVSVLTTGVCTNLRAEFGELLQTIPSDVRGNPTVPVDDQVARLISRRRDSMFFFFNDVLDISEDLEIVRSVDDRGQYAISILETDTGQRLGQISTRVDEPHRISGAVNADFVLVGRPFDDAPCAFNGDPETPCTDAGSVDVYDTRTGEFLWNLRSPGPWNSNYFGDRIEVNEEGIAAITESGYVDFTGRALLMDSRTGEVLWTHGEGHGEYSYPSDMAITRDAVAMSHAGFEYPDNVAVFDVKSGGMRFRVRPTDPFTRFSENGAFDLSDDYLIVGAADEGYRDFPPSGFAMIYDAHTGEQLARLVPDEGIDPSFGLRAVIDSEIALVWTSTEIFVYSVLETGPAISLQAGDADQDLDFDQLDLMKVKIAAKYLTGQAATWGEGDWNGAPGGSVGSPPQGDGVFNQFDIIAAQQAGLYLMGPYSSLDQGSYEALSGESAAVGGDQTSIFYDPSTGELSVDAPAGQELTSINIDSAAGIFTGDAAQNLGGSFDNDADSNVFKATFGGSFGSVTFGNVAQPGLAKTFLLDDLTVVGSLQGGGSLGDVDLIYIPEPPTVFLAFLGALTVVAARRQRCPVCR